MSPTWQVPNTRRWSEQTELRLTWLMWEWERWDVFLWKPALLVEGSQLQSIKSYIMCIHIVHIIFEVIAPTRLWRNGFKIKIRKRRLKPAGVFSCFPRWRGMSFGGNQLLVPKTKKIWKDSLAFWVCSLSKWIVHPDLSFGKINKVQAAWQLTQEIQLKVESASEKWHVIL